MGRFLFWWASAFLLCYGVCFLIGFSSILSFQHVPMRSSTPQVCLIGNAPDEDAADRVFRMWGEQFAGAYYLWNTALPRASSSPKLAYVRRGPRRLTFVEGIKQAFERARSLRLDCDYYFTHDDDLYFQSANSTKEIHDVLVLTLKSYRPLVASFPWEAGIRMHQNLAEIHSAWSSSEIGPLIGFDNGMVLYHSSIVDFFIPYAPRGEGGFVGHWTLGAHFITLFVTMAFRRDSISINSLRYRNSINLDNLSNERRSEHNIDQNGLVYYKSGSRHAYEWPRNNPYKRFLSGGLKCVSCRWGRDLTLQDVRNWTLFVRHHAPRRSEIARSVAAVFHIQHEALVTNSFLAAFSDADLHAVRGSLSYLLRINVFTFNRPVSFTRLFRSLSRALALRSCLCKIDIHIYQDYDPQESISWREQKALLSSGEFQGLQFESHIRSSHQGLRTTILSSWEPQTDDEFCLFLEDDIEIADQAFLYVDAFLRQYWSSPKLPSKHLLGVSLYRPQYSEVTERSIFFPPNSSLLLYEYPTSWGQVFAARPWRTFLDWEAKERGDFLIPNSYTNRWPSATSWKKALLRWMVSTGSVLLYPNLFGNFSLSTNHLESGTNDNLQANSSRWFEMKAKLTAPLLPAHISLSPQVLQQLPVLEAIPRMDAWGNQNPTAQSPVVSSFDTCTVIMAVCFRVHSWKDRIRHFANASFVSTFVLIWQNCIENYGSPSLSEVPVVPFEVRVYSKNNSLNHRFLPLPNISTDCTISVDDDFDMPLHNLSFAVQTWRGHFWNHLVGFAGFGRNHAWEPQLNMWKYSTQWRESFSSIVLPSCLVYHRKYQKMYANLPKEVLTYVDKTMNCDDILFNFLVSNSTHSGPVVVDGDISPKYVRDVEMLGGLWHRVDHFHVRSECLNYFSKVFGFMPLRYTTTYFSTSRGYGSSPGVPPGLRHHRCHVEPPHI